LADFVLYWHRGRVPVSGPEKRKQPPDSLTSNNANSDMTKLLRTTLLMLMLTLLAGTAAAGPMLTTPAGTRYRDLQPGSGETAAAGDIATMHFTGWLDVGGHKGREFYNSRSEGTPVSFVIGTERVMPGWNDGIIGMRPGGRRLLLLPPEMAYGAKGVQDIVPPNSSLIFIIELLDLEKNAAN
jgi:FKBP-type peptidyl-prolyl cis-trans isomerase